MPYNNVISRTDAAALIPEEVVTEMMTTLTEQSAALELFRRVNIGRNVARAPVLSALPTAYFVNGDTGLKQTTEVNWANKYLNVEEIAAIVPIPENVIDDAENDVWGDVRPLLEQAAARTLDAAIFFGANKPASWPADIATAAAAAGNTVTRGTATTAQGGIAGDLSALMSTVEADGFDVNGFVFDRTYRGRFRQARDANGQRIADINARGAEIEGSPVRFAMPGLWPAPALGVAEGFAGDFSEGIIAVRRDFTYKVLDQAVITDNATPPAILYNLAQQDMVALRLTFRVAWQVSNRINYSQANEAARYPFAVMVQPAP